MKITICIGSSCHLKGSRLVIEKLQALVRANQLEGQVVLCGTFCTGNCTKGVSVLVDGRQFSLAPAEVDSFFAEQVLASVALPVAVGE